MGHFVFELRIKKFELILNHSVQFLSDSIRSDPSYPSALLDIMLTI